jgi:hypothetical protein
MNEGAILAARENRKEITQYDLIRSIEKVMLGPERKSHLSRRKRRSSRRITRRPRARLLRAPVRRPGAQDFHHQPRPRGGLHAEASVRRQEDAVAQAIPRRYRRNARRLRRRGDDLRRHHDGALRTTSRSSPRSRATWSPNTACRQNRAGSKTSAYISGAFGVQHPFRALKLFLMRMRGFVSSRADARVA